MRFILEFWRYFCMGETWEYVSVHWQQILIVGDVIRVMDASFERGPQSLKGNPPPYILPICWTKWRHSNGRFDLMKSREALGVKRNICIYIYIYTAEILQNGGKCK